MISRVRSGERTGERVSELRAAPSCAFVFGQCTKQMKEKLLLRSP